MLIIVELLFINIDFNVVFGDIDGFYLLLCFFKVVDFLRS